MKSAVSEHLAIICAEKSEKMRIVTELMKGKHEGVGGNESRCGHAAGGAMKPESQRSECDISEIGISA